MTNMPQDKLNQQVSENDTQIANDYTSRQGQTYADQGKPVSSSNRAHADFSYANNIGGNDYIKPAAPDHSGRHYSDSPYLPNDLGVKFDKWNNVIADNMTHHDPGAVGDAGQFGGLQYAEFQKSDQDGYGVVIEHGQSAAFAQPTTVWVANDRADRGPDQ